MAEREGFEPSRRRTTSNGFRDRRIQPLCHLSARRSQEARRRRAGAGTGAPAVPRGPVRRPERGCWRRGWDSNPRGRSSPPTRFPVALLKPTRTPLRGARGALPESGRTVYDRRRGGGSARPVRAGPLRQRRARKNCCRSATDSAASSPPLTCRQWLRRGSWHTL